MQWNLHFVEKSLPSLFVFGWYVFDAFFNMKERLPNEPLLGAGFNFNISVLKVRKYPDENSYYIIISSMHWERRELYFRNQELNQSYMA